MFDYLIALPSLLLTINLLEAFFFLRVLRPRAGLPQGVLGPGRPIGDLPSPPPCGWSLGFITEPRTVGLIPIWRLRPTVRGSVMNPNDHPHGGGEGKCGIGRPGPSTPWGKPALGLKTRKKNKQSNKYIVRRRDGKALSK